MKKSEIKYIKNIFKSPKKQYYFGELQYGTPYMYPRKFNPTILQIKKEKIKYNRNNSFNFLGFNISYGTPIFIHQGRLGWKDKYNSPRHEWNPSFIIFFFKWQFCIFYRSPDLKRDDTYWEMILWYLYYSDKDLNKARETWGWIDSKTKKSTWNEEYILK